VLNNKHIRTILLTDSQKNPVKFGGQIHVKPPFNNVEHVAPLRHGLFEQALLGP
jgi:hypothetical protein